MRELAYVWLAISILAMRDAAVAGQAHEAMRFYYSMVIAIASGFRAFVGGAA